MTTTDQVAAHDPGDLRPCGRCGQPHDPTRCKGHVDKDSKTREPIPIRQCRNRPMRGQAICDSHGGKAGHNRRAGAKKVADSKAGQLVERSLLGVDVEPIADSVGFMQGLLGRVDHAVGVLDQLVGNMTDSDGGGLVWSDDTRVKVAALTTLLREARRLSTDLTKLGLEDRAISLREDQAELMGEVEDRILEAMMRELLRLLVDHDAAVALVEAAWPRLVAVVVPREWRAIDAVVARS